MRPLIFALLAAVSCPLYAQSCQEADAALAAAYETMIENGRYGGGDWSEEREQRLEQAGKRFRTQLQAYLADHESWQCRFARAEKAGVAVRSSADGKVRAFSWDRQTGGTMRNADTLLQYRSGGRTMLSDRNFSGMEVENITAAGLAPYGTVYFVVSYAKSSSRLYTRRVELLHIAKGRLKPLPLIRTPRPSAVLSYEADVLAEPRLPEARENAHIAYDGKTRTLSLPVVVVEKESDGDGRVTGRRIFYRFDGRYFVRRK